MVYFGFGERCGRGFAWHIVHQTLLRPGGLAIAIGQARLQLAEKEAQAEQRQLEAKASAQPRMVRIRKNNGIIDPFCSIPCARAAKAAVKTLRTRTVVDMDPSVFLCERLKGLR